MQSFALFPFDTFPWKQVKKYLRLNHQGMKLCCKIPKGCHWRGENTVFTQPTYLHVVFLSG